MNLHDLLSLLNQKNVKVSSDNGELRISAQPGVVDAALLQQLKAHKAELLNMYAGDKSGQRTSQGAKSSGVSKITPAMLTMVTLTQTEIDNIVDNVPYGVANVQDIYPLSPLQHGIFFHHLLSEQGDTYLSRSVLGFDRRERLDGFLGALQTVIDRHDILRSAFHWEGLAEPVQVVQRKAKLPVKEVALTDDGEALPQLMAATDPRRVALNLQKAPLLAAYITQDSKSGEWLLCMLNHHLVCDHTSLDMIVSEVHSVLQGRAGNLTAPLPYRNFIAQVQSLPVAEHEAYFRALLGDVDEPTAPFGVLDVQAAVDTVTESHRLLTGQLAQRIRSVARGEGVTPAVLFHLAWAQVLARCCNRSDVVFGSVLSGRLQGTQDDGRIMGMFINTLPVRVSLHKLGVREAVQETYRQLSELLVHEQASLALAQRCSGVVAPLPLFTSMLNYRHSAGVRSAEGHGHMAKGWEGIRTVASEERSNYPIALNVDDQGQDFGLTAQCVPGVDGERLSAYLEEAIGELVNALAHEPQLPAIALGVLPPAERHRLLVEFNATDAAYPTGQLVHQLFEMQAASLPDAVALVFEDRAMSYGELNRKANQVAHRLIGFGVQPDDRVAICAERSMDMVIGLLGILKAGGAYVPLDPTYPQERLAYMLADSAPVAVLTQGPLRDRLPALAGLVVYLDDGLDQEDDGNPVVPALTSSHLAYVIYTSGSTGMPKGVMNQHDGVVNRLHWAQQKFALDGQDRVLQKTPFGFDVSVWEFFLTLGAGATLVIAPPGAHQEPEAIAGLVERHDVTMLHFVPSMLQAFVAHGQAASLANVRHIICSGEALPYALRAQVHAELPEVRLHNLYGPTEAAVDVSCWTCEPDQHVGITPIGKPIANTRLYLLDAHQQPVPLGVVGELYIGGVQVARGYLNRPELTAERFMADPFSTTPGTRMYKTGDLGRWLDDGNIEYLGRNDFQVKLRGLRIELGEIEARLLECESVREAVVLAREDAPGDKRLVAYLVPDEGTVLSTADLRAQLSAVLAEYMVPSAFVTLEALPLTPNGKVDRKALPAPDQSALASRAYEAPRGEVETAIAGIWQQLLGVERVGRHDQFFELGGHSLLAVQFISRARQMLGVEVTLRELFAQPSLSGFASTVARARRADEPPMMRADRSQELPLSWAQQRLWFLNELDHAAGAAYHMPAALRLSGVLDREALQATLDRIVARHENLRTTFVQVDGRPVQRIAAPDCGFALTLHDLQGLGPEQQHEQLRALAADEAASPFDLTTGPLIRGQLIQLSDREHILLVTQHHIISDGWSIGVLIREVGALYSAFSQGQDDPLPPLELQYADYAAWQRQWLQGDVLERQLDFWRSHLNGAPELLTLPTDRPRPVAQSYRGASVDLRLAPELSAALGGLAQRHGCTLFMTLFAGWAVLMARLSGQDDVVIGTPVANRQRLEIESLIGFFVNSLAVRVRLDDDPGVGALLERVRATMLDAYTHQDVPFEQVVEAVQPMRSLSHSPLFQTMFTLNNASTNGALNLPGLGVAPLAVEHGTTHFDLSLSLTDTGAGIVGSIDYAIDLFDADTVGRMAGYFERLLAVMAADQEKPVSRIGLLSDEQRDQLLARFTGTTAAYPAEQLIHQLVEAQALAQPEATALVFEDRTMRYGELNRKANQVAHRLIRLGVRPDERVAICAERSMEMVIGLLGILKAGGAYVPLDPNYPHERLAYMLADSAPVAVLTQGRSLDALPALAMPVIALDDGLDQEDEGNPVVPDLTPSHLAYVIYTSGSTGTPKGVMNQHDGVLNRLYWGRQKFALDGRDRVLQKTPFGFDVSVWEFFQPLDAGSTLVIAPPGAHQEPDAIAGLVERHGVTMLHFVPSMLQAFVAHDKTASLAKVKHIICSGEALPYALRAQVHAELPQVRLHNLYGPTEAGIEVSCWTSDPDQHAGITPMGRPIANTRLYLLDAHRQPVPLGVAGELYIGGVQVARGYLNRPELTAERFVPDPFGTTPDARMYKTGDLVRLLADGNIEYLGRNDFQVKLRGLRIELGEIEARLLACEGVREAVVVAREDAPGDKRLVAYLVADEGEVLSAADLRTQLSAVLAEYMVPSAFVMLEAMPLTSNGKVDRKALPAPDQSALVSRAYEAPQDEVETAIAGIWQQLLGVEKVGRHDHFFELGGHSLQVITLIEQLRKQGYRADVKTIFLAPTVAGLAAAMGAEHRAGDEFAVPANLIATDATAITPEMLPLVTLTQAEIDGIAAAVEGGVANIQDMYPLSPLQQGILFHHMLNAHGGDTYLLRSVLAFDRRERLDGFLDALQTVIDRHDILRSAFHWDGLAQPVQVVQRQANLPIVEVAPSDDRDALAQLMDASNPRHVTLDLRKAPLLAAYIARDGESGEWLLSLLNHHLVCDHTAMEIVVAEVHGVLQGQSAALGAPLPYRNFIAQIQSLPVAEHEAYFRTLLGDVDEPTAPFGVLDVQGAGDTVVETRALLDDDLAGRIRGAARAQGVTPAVLFHLAWAQVLAQCCNRSDVVFGSVLSGRLQGTQDAGRIMGMFINTLPVRVTLDGVSVQQAVQDTYRQLSELLAHEQAPLALAQRCSAVVAPLPLFTSVLNYRHSEGLLSEEGHGHPSAGWEGIRALAMEERTNYPIALSVDDLGRQFGLSAQCIQGVDGERLVAYLEQAVNVLVDALDHAPQRPLGALSALPPAERHRLLVEFNAADAACPSEQLVHQLFEAQALAQPEATALVFEERTMSYGELNRKANQLAHRLIRLGVQPDDRVAICAERSMEMIVGLLGILKAGGAYVPLDPAYPAARLDYMLKDSAPRAVVTPALHVERFCDSGWPVLLLDLDAADTGSEADNPAREGLRSTHLANVIYTSGSSGQPKGVMLEHRNVVWLAMHRGLAPLGPQDRVANCASPSFDATTWEIWGALLNGASVLIVAQDVLLDPARFSAQLLSGEVSAMLLTTGLFNAYLDTIAPALSKLKYLLFGGDVVDPYCVARALNRAPAWQLIHCYGPTESTTIATAGVITAVPPEAVSIPIGRPIANARVYILDAHLQPVPIGVAGELYVAGAGVARGYLNRSELTGERFLADPFSDDPEARMYKTGDLGRWRDDGNIEFVGRNDFQVKLRGFRIELGEIEARLQECDGVREAVVLAREDAPGDKRLVAYVAPHAGASLSAADLRAQLSATLAEYMTPSAFVILEALPLTPNGKVDRKALPAPDESALVSRAYEAPQGELELAIAEIWQDLLGVGAVGRNDHFFELGGHSLNGVQLVSRVQARTGLEVPLRALFAHPVLAEFASVIASGSAKQSLLAAIRPTGRFTPLFLVHAGGGDVGYVEDLAPYIDQSTPVYGISASGFLAGEAAAYAIEEMAATYIGEIRKVQAQGPYRLGGYSAGGVIAYEMARQLIAQGEIIDFVGLIDTHCRLPGEQREPVDGAPVAVDEPVEEADAGGSGGWWRNLWSTLRQRTRTGENASGEALPVSIDAEPVDRVAKISKADTLMTFLSDHITKEEFDFLNEYRNNDDVESIIAFCMSGRFPSIPDDRPLFERHLEVRHGILSALDKYEFAPISSRVTLFRAQEQMNGDRITDDKLTEKWMHLLDGNVRVISVPGNHMNIVKHPNLTDLGAAISGGKAHRAAPIGFGQKTKRVRV